MLPWFILFGFNLDMKWDLVFVPKNKKTYPCNHSFLHWANLLAVAAIGFSSYYSWFTNEKEDKCLLSRRKEFAWFFLLKHQKKPSSRPVNSDCNLWGEFKVRDKSIKTFFVNANLKFWRLKLCQTKNQDLTKKSFIRCSSPDYQKCHFKRDFKKNNIHWKLNCCWNPDYLKLHWCIFLDLLKIKLFPSRVDELFWFLILKSLMILNILLSIN